MPQVCLLKLTSLKPFPCPFKFGNTDQWKKATVWYPLPLHPEGTADTNRAHANHVYLPTGLPTDFQPSLFPLQTEWGWGSERLSLLLINYFESESYLPALSSPAPCPTSRHRINNNNNNNNNNNKWARYIEQPRAENSITADSKINVL